jgi:hypothetical protein
MPIKGQVQRFWTSWKNRSKLFIYVHSTHKNSGTLFFCDLTLKNDFWSSFLVIIDIWITFHLVSSKVSFSTGTDVILESCKILIAKIRLNAAKCVPKTVPNYRYRCVFSDPLHPLSLIHCFHSILGDFSSVFSDYYWLKGYDAPCGRVWY